MEVNTPYLRVRDDGEFAVRLNTVRPGRPFVSIDLSEDARTGLTVESVEEIDRLIRAATAARELLISALISEEGEELGRTIAADEGLEPTPETCGARHNAYLCTLSPGHGGPHQTLMATGHELASWPQTGGES